VFGHDYPVKGVSLQVDSNPPFQIGAHNATGCVVADNTLLKQLRAGRELTVTFLRWPWGESKATFSLHRSSRALDELERLVAVQ
jgi:invasion protein IalB